MPEKFRPRIEPEVQKTEMSIDMILEKISDIFGKFNLNKEEMERGLLAAIRTDLAPSRSDMRKINLDEIKFYGLTTSDTSAVFLLDFAHGGYKFKRRCNLSFASIKQNGEDKIACSWHIGTISF